MAWDTPSVNRQRLAPAAAAAAPVRNVTFGAILRRLLLATLVAFAFGWAASWALPAFGLGPTVGRVLELAAGALGLGFALRLQWRPAGRPGLPQSVRDRADQPWAGGGSGGGAMDNDFSAGTNLAESVAEVLLDAVADFGGD